MARIHVVIPARFASTRLPGKPLMEIAGRAMVLHVFDRATEAAVGDVTIATDDRRVAEVCEAGGARAVMTRDEHASGTDRIAEVAAAAGWAGEDIVINVQGDEPDLPPECIRQLAKAMHEGHAMATLATPVLTASEFEDPGVVKVVCDANGCALYFSRAGIPVDRDEGGFGSAYRHIGLYAYTVATLRQLTQEAPCAPERMEQLEQLRALYHGIRIRVLKAAAVPHRGVDTERDLDAVRKRMDA